MPARALPDRARNVPHPRTNPPDMNVFANTVVTLSFKLYDSNNQLIEQTDEPIAYLHGGHSGKSATPFLSRSSRTMRSATMTPS